MVGHVDGVREHHWVTDTETGVIQKNKLQTNDHIYIQQSLDLRMISNLADFKSNMLFFFFPSGKREQWDGCIGKNSSLTNV